MRTVGAFVALYCVAFAVALPCSAPCSAGMTGRTVDLKSPAVAVQPLPVSCALSGHTLIRGMSSRPRFCLRQPGVGEAVAGQVVPDSRAPCCNKLNHSTRLTAERPPYPPPHAGHSALRPGQASVRIRLPCHASRTLAPSIRTRCYSAALSLRASHSSTLMRGSSNRSVTREYQPLPCMRPIRSSFGVSI